MFQSLLLLLLLLLEIYNCIFREKIKKLLLLLLLGFVEHVKAAVFSNVSHDFITYFLVIRFIAGTDNIMRT